MAGIVLKDVKKVYNGGVEAVKGVSIDVRDGEFIVLVGPSGCGKSTLLRMVAGLETVSSGEVRIADRMVNEVEPADRDIAMVFQNYALYPHMTVYQNLAYGLKNRNTPKSEIDARITEAARMLEITQYLERKPRALSGGQRQRVAMDPPNQPPTNGAKPVTSPAKLATSPIPYTSSTDPPHIRRGICCLQWRTRLLPPRQQRLRLPHRNYLRGAGPRGMGSNLPYTCPGSEAA